MVIGHALAILLHVIVFPTEVTMTKPTSKVLTESLDNFTNVLDTKEWVASEPKMGIVPVTTSVSLSGSPGINK
jgi:hypothetical protein